MQNLNHWKNIIIEKRKTTSFRNFLKEVVSWHPYILNKTDNLISRFPKSERIKIIDKDSFNESRDDLTKKWIEYNFEKDFFGNFSFILSNTPIASIFHYKDNLNSDYTDIAVDSKNAYLSSCVVLYSQNVCYSFMVRGECIYIFNSLYVSENSENVYFSRWVIKSYKIFYSSYITNSNNIWFSSNLIWCSECISCSNLINQKYCINNKKLSKQNYLKEKDKILKNKRDFLNKYINTDKIWKNYWSENISWNYVINSENVENGNYVSWTQDAKNIMFIWAKSLNKNFYDVFIAWWSWRYDNYWVQNTWGSDLVFCSACIWYSMNIFYSYFLDGCSYCIWCVWLKNKSYCILNKQYSKEEWEIMADKIFNQMNIDWILWDFFPWDLNPFYFNDTVAWLIWWFLKEEVEKEGYMWRKEEIKIDIPEWSVIVKSSELNDFQYYNKNWEWTINPEIMKKVIVDEKWNYYRIVKMEYDFLVKHWLPLPEIHR